jgi:cell division protein FtsB
MLRKYRLLRRLLLSLALYIVAAATGGYFVWHGVHGQRGLRTGEEYEQKLTRLRFERDLLKLERMQWERRLALVKGENVDADILDEEVRRKLGRVHHNEVVVLLPPTTGAAPDQTRR